MKLSVSEAFFNLFMHSLLPISSDILEMSNSRRIITLPTYKGKRITSEAALLCWNWSLIALRIDVFENYAANPFDKQKQLFRKLLYRFFLVNCRCRQVCKLDLVNELETYDIVCVHKDILLHLRNLVDTQFSFTWFDYLWVIVDLSLAFGGNFYDGEYTHFLQEKSPSLYEAVRKYWNDILYPRYEWGKKRPVAVSFDVFEYCRALKKMSLIIPPVKLDIDGKSLILDDAIHYLLHPRVFKPQLRFANRTLYDFLTKGCNL